MKLFFVIYNGGEYTPPSIKYIVAENEEQIRLLPEFKYGILDIEDTCIEIDRILPKEGECKLLLMNQK